MYKWRLIPFTIMIFFLPCNLKAVINDFFENTLLFFFLPYFFIDSTVENLKPKLRQNY